MSGKPTGALNRRDVLKQSAVVAAACVTGLGAGVGCRNHHSRIRSGGRKRVIIVGIDGMDSRLAESMMNAGLLPHFDQLRQRGGFRRLGTTIPPQSPVAWASFINGAGPGSHGDRRASTLPPAGGRTHGPASAASPPPAPRRPSCSSWRASGGPSPCWSFCVSSSPSRSISASAGTVPSSSRFRSCRCSGSWSPWASWPRFCRWGAVLRSWAHERQDRSVVDAVHGPPPSGELPGCGP